jgi:hypothetical protein
MASCTTTTGTTFDPGNLGYGTSYQWKVVAKDKYGATSESSWWYFTTKSNDPSPPSEGISTSDSSTAA